VVSVCFLVSLPGAQAPFAPCEDPGIRGSGALRVAVCGEVDAQAPSGPIRRLFGLPIDVNGADADTLSSLPGIGPSRAQAIIEGRPYAEPNELRRVPGIGAKRLARIRHLISAESRLREEPIASHETTWR
jgi:hypothetical protein